MMKKNKMIIFIFLLILLIIVLFYGIFGTGISYLSSKEIKENRELNSNLIKELKINNIDTVYDKNTNLYYYMISENYENKIYVLNFNLNKNLKYKLVGETLNIIKVDYNKPIKIIIYNDKYYYETSIQLTNLPLINITTEDNIIEDTKSIFSYINVNKSQMQFTNNTKIQVRGNTSKNFDKKSYKINFSNKSYTKEKDVNISNFYYGDSFILDAVYRDPSKIRNVLSIELWNSVSKDFTNVSIYSEFVELFINNEYKGLYVLTEPINRRKLNLNKSDSNDTSIVVKVQEWNDLNSDLDFTNIETDTYMGYELKYPNDENLYKECWEKILTNISKYYDSEIDSSYETISSTFNLKDYIDMIIFNAFINNSDNRLDKNNYFYTNSLKSNEVFIQPWDMEYTFGIRYKTSAERNVYKDMNDYKTLYTDFYHTNSKKINKLLIDRYWVLRQNILTKEYFDNLLDNYKEELTKGAALRDSNTWYEYDIEKEIEDIRTWIYNRIEFFDEYIKGLENE